MSFLAVLLALLIEQVRPLPHTSWSAELLRGWARWAGTNFDAGKERHAWVVLAVSLLLPAGLVIAVHRLLSPFGAIVELLFNVAVLYVTLGFRHFSHYFTDIRKAMERGDELAARQLLGEWLRMDTIDLPRTELLRHVLEHSLLAAHRHVFGVFFWFIVCAMLGLGPAGAVLYRLAEFVERYWSAKDPMLGAPLSERLSLRAQQVFQWLDFLPVRLTAFGFAIVGDFEAAIDEWRRDAHLWQRPNDGVILASAAGALGVRLGDGSMEHPVLPMTEAVMVADTESSPLIGTAVSSSEGHTAGVLAEPGHLRSVVGLIWRSVLLWMFLLVIVTIANFLG
jgi:adenosylcobinamide-phosphate synthase